MKLIHISDIHINQEPILGSDPIAHFQTCMDHVEKHNSDADMVVITGDLTHQGQRSSYEKLSVMLAGWAVKPVLMIGNHDNRSTFCDVFQEVATDPNGYVQFVENNEAGRFIFLDTVRDGTHAGHFGPRRQRWLRDQLDTASKDEVPAFIFMHHNPVEVGVANADIVGLIDVEALQNILKEYRDTIRHIFFGHCHYILSGSVCGVPFSAPRSTNHNCVPEFTGDTRMGHAPFSPTYNVCLISDDAMVVHSIDFCDVDKIQWID